MRRIFVSLAKRYAIGAVNDLLDRNRGDVAKISETISIWTGRLERVLDCLKRINERVSDGRLESGEVDDSLKEIEILVKGF